MYLYNYVSFITLTVLFSRLQISGLRCVLEIWPCWLQMGQTAFKLHANLRFSNECSASPLFCLLAVSVEFSFCFILYIVWLSQSLAPTKPPPRWSFFYGMHMALTRFTHVPVSLAMCNLIKVHTLVIRICQALWIRASVFFNDNLFIVQRVNMKAFWTKQKLLYLARSAYNCIKVYKLGRV